MTTIKEGAPMAQQEKEKPPSFAAMLAAVRPGTDIEAAETLRKVVAAVKDTGKVGSLVIRLDVKPADGGADAVIVTDASVDVYNPKVVRSTAGSLFHVPVVLGEAILPLLARLRAAGLTTYAADGAGERTLDGVDLSAPHAWVLGNEAWGLPASTRQACDDVVRIPIRGRAESLNLAMAATLCLYGSARAHR